MRRYRTCDMIESNERRIRNTRLWWGELVAGKKISLSLYFLFTVKEM